MDLMVYGYHKTFRKVTFSGENTLNDVAPESVSWIKPHKNRSGKTFSHVRLILQPLLFACDVCRFEFALYLCTLSTIEQIPLDTADVMGREKLKTVTVFN